MSDAVVRLQAESGEAALSCTPEGMSEGPKREDCEAVGRACPFTCPAKMSL